MDMCETKGFAERVRKLDSISAVNQLVNCNWCGHEAAQILTSYASEFLARQWCYIADPDFGISLRCCSASL